MSDCVFCRILSGDEHANFVYRDETVAAFMDIQPVTPGHVLIVPTAHAAYLAHIDEQTAAHLMRIGHRLAAAIRASDLRSDGINLFLADGEAAMQHVFHVHLHVIPRFVGDGFGLNLPPDYGELPTRSTLEEAAKKIRAALPNSISADAG